MLPAPNVVAVDDDKADLDAIVDCLHGLGCACLPVHVQRANVSLSEPIRGIRLLFFDIRYLPAVDTGTPMFEVAAKVLMATLAPDNGPYVLVTWSTHGDEHEQFLRYLNQECPDIPPPAASALLAKEQFGAGSGAKPADEKLVDLGKKITTITASNPQVSALLKWQVSAERAAGDVVQSLIEQLPREACFLGQTSEDLEAILLKIARAAVGQQNVQASITRAINEGLGPLLYDRVINATKVDDEIWGGALPDLRKDARLTQEQAVHLNSRSLLSTHDLDSIRVGDRGAVISLPATVNGKAFERVFGIDEAWALREFLQLKGKVKNENEEKQEPAWLELRKATEWVLVGCRAACDQAQRKGRLNPVLLGLHLPTGMNEKCKVAEHGAFYVTPEFRTDGEPFRLVLNWHFWISLADETLDTADIKYRLREGIIEFIVRQCHIHGARPGLINYR